MTTEHQKSLEMIYAKKASELLGEAWNVQPSPDEVNWPDLIVTTESGKFGLEVKEVYRDESRKGSTKKANESNNVKKIKKLTDAYYNATCISIMADLRGDISNHDQLLKAIIAEVPQLSVSEQRRIVPYTGCYVDIRRLPDEFGEYKRWNYVSDRVGWVINMDRGVIDSAIDGKARKLLKYSKEISDIRLLLVSNVIFNSGNVRLEDDFTCEPRGFSTVYYLSYPETACKLSCERTT